MNFCEKAEGTAEPSFLSHHLETLHREHRETREELDDIKGTACVIYGAGGETVSVKISFFFSSPAG